MTKNMKLEELLDIVTTSIMTILLLIFANFMGLTLMIVLVPLVVILVKYSYRNYLLALCFTVLAGMLFRNPISHIFSVAYIFLISISVGTDIRKSKSIWQIIIKASLISIGYFVATTLIIYLISDGQMITELKKTANEAINIIESRLGEDINVSDKDLEVYGKLLRETINFSISVFPALAIIASFIISALNTVFSLKFLKKLGLNVNYQTDFSQYRLPDSAKNFAVLLAVSSLIVSFINISNKELIIDNLTLLMMFILLVSGSLLIYNILSKFMSRPLVIFLLILLIVILQFHTLVAILGSFDLFWNIRDKIQIRKREK